VFPKATRVVVWRWSRDEDWHEAIECAIRSDQSSPAAGFCQSLRRGVWTEDPGFQPPVDLDQIADWSKLLAAMEHVGRHGMPARAGDVNYLHSGIWEFKRADRRLTYWDTDGAGNYTAKAKHRDPTARSSAPQEDDYWWYPDMDAVLRLGCSPQAGMRMAEGRTSCTATPD
jgi:hypothetical protein